MNTRERGLFFRQAMLAVWGMATLILLFTVLLLGRTLYSQGHNPLEKPAPAAAVAEKSREVAPATLAPRECTLYFVEPEGRFLAPEVRQIQCDEFTVDNCRALLAALISGPQGNGAAGGLAPVLPAAAKVRAVYLVADGELVVDLSREAVEALPRSALSEALMAYGIVNTLSQAAVQGAKDPAVRAVRLLVEGSAPEETFEAHMELSNPLAPDPRWIVNQEAPQPSHV